MSALKILTTLEYLETHSLEDLRGMSVQVLVSDSKLDISVFNKLSACGIQPEFITTVPENVDYAIGYIMGRSLQGSNAIIALSDKNYEAPDLANKRAIVSNSFRKAKDQLDQVEKEMAEARANGTAPVRGRSSRRNKAVIAPVPVPAVEADVVVKHVDEKKINTKVLGTSKPAETEKPAKAPAKAKETKVAEEAPVEKVAKEVKPAKPVEKPVEKEKPVVEKKAEPAPKKVEKTEVAPKEVAPAPVKTSGKASDYKEIKKLLDGCNALKLAKEYNVTEDWLCEQVVYCLNASFEYVSYEVQLQITIKNPALTKALYDLTRKSYDILKKAATKIK